MGKDLIVSAGHQVSHNLIRRSYFILVLKIDG